MMKEAEMAARTSCRGEVAGGIDLKIVSLMARLRMEWRIAWDQDSCFSVATLPD